MAANKSYKNLLMVTAFIVCLVAADNLFPIRDDAETVSLKEDSGITKDAPGEKLSLREIEEIYPGLNYDAVINKYKNNIGEEFSITKFKYFAVFSNLDEELTYNLLDNDIRNAVSTMEKNYIQTKPDEVTAVFLFDDRGSYTDFSRDALGIPLDDLSPYGYFKISKNVIAVRYISWKGSLPHEVTHAFINADFPNIPSWLNEAMGALHEKATLIKGELKGDFNYRIVSLRRAFEENTYTPLKVMMSTNDDELYGNRSPYYYAQGRYLVGYLQEKGLLTKYYKYFRETWENDDTGITQLEKFLGKDIDSIDRDYVAYVKGFQESR